MKFYQWGVIATVCLSTQAGPARAASEPIKPFPRTAVRLTPSLWEKGQAQDGEYLLALEPERLLRCFRETAGLPAPGKAYGGWEAETGELRGHVAGGHYLSALALMYASTSDARFKERGDLMVSELAKCQNANGYLSAFPESFFERVENGRHVWAPYYTVHKVFAGLLDQYEWCGNQQALEMAKKLAVYFEKRNETFNAEKMKTILRIEAGGFVESLWNLYAITQEERFKTFAEKFEKSVFLQPLMEGKDNLTSLHGNTHIPLVLGAMRRWELTGDRRYLELSKLFWECVVEKRCWATGGTTGPGENWGEAGKLAEIMSLTSHETCKTHNMLRLSRKLFAATGDPRYADYIAHAHLNGILGTQGPEAGQFEYYVPQATGYHRWYGYPDKSMWCCYGTGIESFAKLGDSVFFHQGDTLYISQFIPCVLDWKEKHFQLAIETKYPLEESVKFVVKATDGGKRTLRILKPSWASHGVAVSINGKPVTPKQEGGFIELSEAWKAGDTITVKFPMSLRALPLPDDPQQVAIVYGPVVLAGILERPETKAFMTERAGEEQPGLEKKRKMYYFNAPRPDDLSWLKPVEGKPMHFRAEGQPLQVEFMPFFMVTSEIYGLYWPVVAKNGVRQQALDKQNRALDLIARLATFKAGEAVDALEKEYAGFMSDKDVSSQHDRLRVAMAKAFKAAGQTAKVVETLKPMAMPFISSQPKYAEVLALLGDEAETKGIRPLVWDEGNPNGDGAGIRETLDGVPVIKTFNAQLHFIYFSFVPKARKAMTGKDVRITVKYRSDADLLMHYDAMGNAYLQLKPVKVETEGAWKIATFECGKAQFGGRQNYKADLRIYAADHSILTVADLKAEVPVSPSKNP